MHFEIERTCMVTIITYGEHRRFHLSESTNGLQTRSKQAQKLSRNACTPPKLMGRDLISIDVHASTANISNLI